VNSRELNGFRTRDKKNLMTHLMNKETKRGGGGAASVGDRLGVGGV